MIWRELFTQVNWFSKVKYHILVNILISGSSTCCILTGFASLKQILLLKQLFNFSKSQAFNSNTPLFIVTPYTTHIRAILNYQWKPSLQLVLFKLKTCTASCTFITQNSATLSKTKIHNWGVFLFLFWKLIVFILADVSSSHATVLSSP